MIGIQTIGLVTDKCFVCKVDFIVGSLQYQQSLASAEDVFKMTVAIQFEIIGKRPYTQASRYCLENIKDIVEKFKLAVTLDDF